MGQKEQVAYQAVLERWFYQIYGGKACGDPNCWACVRGAQMGNPPAAPFNPFNIQPASGGEGVIIDPTLKLDKGDYCQLKVSKRKFRILDERKDDQSNFEELCKFDDDNRNPIWLPHSWLVGEVNILEKA